MNKILITGAAGFIGSHLVEYLLKEGVPAQKLRLLIHPDESLENLPKVDFEIIKGDICDSKVTKKIVNGVSVIYHLAAVTRDGEGSYSVNFIGTKNLVNACRKIKINKFVFFSTIAVFGLPAFAGDRIDITEDSPKNVVGEYAESKYLAEQEVMRAHEEFGLPYVIVRPTTVYGPRDKAGIYQLFKAIKGNYFVRIGNGKNKVDYVYVTDLVKGVRQAQLYKKKTGDFILGAKEPVFFNHIIDSVAESLGKRVPNWYIPRLFAILLGQIVELISKFTGLSIPFSANRVKVMTANYYFNCQKAKKALNYKPEIPFTFGAQEVARWFLKKEYE